MPPMNQPHTAKPSATHTVLQTLAGGEHPTPDPAWLAPWRAIAHVRATTLMLGMRRDRDAYKGVPRARATASGEDPGGEWGAML